MGKTIGEGRIHMIRPYVKTMQALFLLMGLLCCGMILLTRNAIINIYTVSAETKALAALSAFVLQLSPLATFYILKADQILKRIPNSIKCNRYRWVKILTRK